MELLEELLFEDELSLKSKLELEELLPELELELDEKAKLELEEESIELDELDELLAIIFQPFLILQNLLASL
jgi:hypothetical protein